MIQDTDIRPPSLFLMRVFYLLVAFTLAISLLNHQKELTFLGSMILGMVFVVKTWSRLSLRNLRFDLTAQSCRLFPGDTIIVTMRVENAKWLPIWIQLRANMDNRLRRRARNRYLSRDTWIWPYQTRELSFKLPARQRGIYTIGPFVLKGGDLLGFYAESRAVPVEFQAIVYPQVRNLKPVTLPRHDFFGAPGAKHQLEDPIYLLGTQDYQHRRPAKFIHWKASARRQRLQEKLCEPSAQEKVMLTIDVTQFNAYDDAGTFEKMLEISASMAVQLYRRGLGVGLLANGRTIEDVPEIIPIGYGPNQLSTILETMARLEMRAKQSMEDALMTGVGSTAGISFAHFTNFGDEQTRKAERVLRFMKLKGTVYLCHPKLDDEGEVDDMPPNYHHINDLCIRNE